MMTKFRWLLVVLLVGTLGMQATVYTPSSVPNPKLQGQEYYVANPDALIPDSDVVFLNRCAQRLEEATDVEMCVAVLWSIGDADCFDFCYELFQRWGIGGKGKNTGVLICFVMDSHDIRIMTGTGIEGVLSDARCSQIIHNEMIPSFRKGQYGEGLCFGALRIYEICTDGEAPEELLHMKSVTNRGKYAEEDEWTEEDKENMVTALMFGLMILFGIGIWIKSKIAARRVCPKCKKRRGEQIKERIIKAASYAAAGNSIRTYRCSKCGHEWDEEHIIPKHERTSSGSSYTSSGRSYTSSSRSYSSSSHGSWGGGSTSGGGAGAKW